MTEKEFLFIGGPLHGQWLPVDLVPRRTDAPGFYAPDAVESVVPEKAVVGVGDEGEAPGSITRLDYALTYHRRRVANASRLSPTEGYTVEVFVVETVTDGAVASQYLNDAITHRWFVEHGTPVELKPPPDQHRANGSGLIIPGR